jgi:hypothetical protein
MPRPKAAIAPARLRRKPNPQTLARCLYALLESLPDECRCDVIDALAVMEHAKIMGGAK